eukprot:5322110-Prymnesium_polylepis.1
MCAQRETALGDAVALLRELRRDLGEGAPDAPPPPPAGAASVALTAADESGGGGADGGGGAARSVAQAASAELGLGEPHRRR